VKLTKRPLGVRVDADTQAMLKRIAATEGISINNLVERIITGHLSNRQQGRNAVDLQGEIRELEEWIAQRHERLQSALEATERRLEKSLAAIRGMVNANVEMSFPTRMEEYRRLVAGTLRQMGIATSKNNGNGATSE
jgi:hypothetical protein